MDIQQTNLLKIAESLPQQYLEELLDFARFLSAKSVQSANNDTDYLNSIPGMVDSIVESRKTEIKDCFKELEW